MSRLIALAVLGAGMVAALSGSIGMAQEAGGGAKQGSGTDGRQVITVTPAPAQPTTAPVQPTQESGATGVYKR